MRGHQPKKAPRKKPPKGGPGTARFNSKAVKNGEEWRTGIMIGIPSLGQVRIEWHNCMMNIVMPMNYSSASIIQPVNVLTPLRYHVAEAQNIVVMETLNQGWEWLLFIEDDVCIPPDIMLRLNQWTRYGKYPIVSGLYNLKSTPPEPMVFRGRGNGPYLGWKKGPGAYEKKAKLPKAVKPNEIIMTDGVPTGCFLVSCKLLQAVWDESPSILLRRAKTDNTTVEFNTREVFKTRREAGIDPETWQYTRTMATSDLDFCDKVLADGKRLLKKAGFEEAAKLRYPFIIDKKITCGHIDPSGRIY